VYNRSRETRNSTEKCCEIAPVEHCLCSFLFGVLTKHWLLVFIVQVWNKSIAFRHLLWQQSATGGGVIKMKTFACESEFFRK
jgi:hypothetical protein